jgi:3-oxoacyl-[acyl-carrier-protein] synthase III
VGLDPAVTVLCDRAYMNLFVAATGSALPEPTTLEDAERAGLCERKLIWRTQLKSVCIAEESGPELAVRAARAADPTGRINIVLHASVYYQGHDLWSPPSYLQREVLGNSCPAIEVRQQSNGGMAALELAGAYLAADSSREQALVTTGDRFCLPGFDRWLSDPGTICGDGGTAAVLSTKDGMARVRSLVTVSDPGLEKLGRGLDPFADAPLATRQPISTDTHRSELIAEFGFTPLLERLQNGQRQAFHQALDEAGVDATDVDWFVLPNLGRAKMDAQFFEPLKIDPERSTWDWGSHIGHLGAGDQIAGLDHLARSGRLESGQLCVLAGVGVGFTWSVAVLEIT